MLGDLSPDLIRIGAVEPELNDELWVLTHPDIRKSGRIYAFMTHCIEAISKNRDLVEGLRGKTSGQRSEAEINSSSFLSEAAQP